MNKIWPGKPYPLGAQFDGFGTNFAVFSGVAERVQLCLFSDDGSERQIDLTCGTGQVWHAYLPEVGPGTRYGFRVHGPWDPGRGLRCNPNKLLVDPYARGISEGLQWGPALQGHRDDGGPSTEDSAPHTFRSVVVQPYFDWGNDRRLEIPWNETVIYEVHVKGFTQRHPDIPAELRGTYAGVAHPASIAYLKSLGITAVELLPIHAFVHDGFLLDRGLRNYWGYHSIGYFAPHPEYASVHTASAAVAEVKHMVKTLHQHGIEVILDVVYNHTAEGNHAGPQLSMKGIDNGAYYRLVGDKPEFYMDYTGTGNTLNMRHPHVLQMVMDSLRYWIEEIHVDGFRFDPAALALACARGGSPRRSTTSSSRTRWSRALRLIAEPWDVGGGGYQVGNFPPLWSEWNGKYRDWIRDYWRGEPGSPNELGSRLAGSDLWAGGRTRVRRSTSSPPTTASLRDLVSYNEAQRADEQRGCRDGEVHNRSWNCGAEDRRTIQVGRLRRRRAQLPRDDVPLAGRTDAARRRRARPHAQREQQRLLPGHRDLVVRLGRRRQGAARVHPASSQRSCGSSTRCCRRGWFRAGRSVARARAPALP